MTDKSCCDGEATAARSSGSRVVHCRDGFRWDGVPVAEYKAPGTSWNGVSRTTLVGNQDEQTSFHVRYFEIAPSGYTSLEQHSHEHAVLVLRGRGVVQLGEQTHDLAFGDLVYVAPNEVHQFRNTAAAEPLGFICVVDARRDAGVAVAREQTAK